MYPLFSSITASAFLNHIVTYVMPGEVLELGEHESLAAAAKRSPEAQFSPHVPTDLGWKENLPVW